MTALIVAAMVAHCKIVALVYVPAMRGSIVTIGCTDRELGA